MASMMPRLALIAATIAILTFFTLANPIAEEKLIRIQRDTTTPSSNVTTTTSGRLICQPPTACGWAVYTNYERTIDYFMKNVCECPQNLSCLRATDDLSIKAFVYRCQVKDPNHEST